MSTLILMIMTSLALTAVLTAIMLLISKKMLKEREKMITFECGFNPLKKARAPFSLKFFLFTIIFLIFDIEIALLLPLGFINLTSPSSLMTLYGLIITLILILGLIYEWNQGMLNWIL